MSDIEIAQKATMKPVLEIGASLGIGAEHLEPYGHYKAKISLKYLDSLPIFHWLYAFKLEMGKPMSRLFKTQ